MGDFRDKNPHKVGLESKAFPSRWLSRRTVTRNVLFEVLKASRKGGMAKGGSRLRDLIRRGLLRRSTFRAVTERRGNGEQAKDVNGDILDSRGERTVIDAIGTVVKR
jgi:hypothetical protein